MKYEVEDNYKSDNESYIGYEYLAPREICGWQ